MAVCELVPDVPVNGVTVFGVVVVTIPTSKDLAAASPLVVAFKLRV